MEHAFVYYDKNFLMQCLSPIQLDEFDNKQLKCGTILVDEKIQQIRDGDVPFYYYKIKESSPHLKLIKNDIYEIQTKKIILLDDYIVDDSNEENKVKVLYDRKKKTITIENASDNAANLDMYFTEVNRNILHFSFNETIKPGIKVLENVELPKRYKTLSVLGYDQIYYEEI